MENIPWYQSAIVRQQIVQIIVALTAVLGVKLGAFDVDATLAAIFAGIAGVVGVWTLITRLTKPAPNLTAAAARKEVELVKAGTIPPSPTGPATKQGGFVKPMLGAMICGLILFGTVTAAVVIPACSALGVPTPQTFNEKEASAIVSVTAVRKLAITLLTADKISAADARNVQQQADNLREGIQLASTLHAGDPSAGEDRLSQIITAVAALNSYLLKRK